MKSTVGLTVFILCGMASAACQGQDPAGFAELYRAGQSHHEAGRHAEARSSFEAALSRAATGAEKDETQIAIGLTYDAEKKYAEWDGLMQKLFMRRK